MDSLGGSVSSSATILLTGCEFGTLDKGIFVVSGEGGGAGVSSGTRNVELPAVATIDGLKVVISFPTMLLTGDAVDILVVGELVDSDMKGAVVKFGSAIVALPAVAEIKGLKDVSEPTISIVGDTVGVFIFC